MKALDATLRLLSWLDRLTLGTTGDGCLTLVGSRNGQTVYVTTLRPPV